MIVQPDFSPLCQFLDSYAHEFPERKAEVAHIQTLIQETLSNPHRNNEAVLDQLRGRIRKLDAQTASTIISLGKKALGLVEKRDRQEDPSDRSMSVAKKAAQPTDVFCTTFHALRTRGDYVLFNYQGFLKVNPDNSGLILEPKSFGNIFSTEPDDEIKKVAAIFRDDAMIAGLRRVFLVETLKNPPMKEQIQKAVASTLRTFLSKEMSPASIENIVERITGDRTILRQPSMDPTTAQRLFAPPEAQRDIKYILEAAANPAMDIQSSTHLVQELFCYAYPETHRPGHIEEALRNGILILMNKGLTAKNLYEVCRIASQRGDSPCTILNRFSLLFLANLSFVDRPYKLLTQYSTLLGEIFPKTGATEAPLTLLQQFIELIGTTRKKDADTCFVGAPLFLSLPQGFPETLPSVSSEKIQSFITAFSNGLSQKEYCTVAKDSLPGLRAFALLFDTTTNIHSLFALRPKDLRTGNERKDISLFLHHLLRSAEFQERPETILLKIFELLSSRFIGTRYESSVKDFFGLLKISVFVSRDLQKFFQYMIDSLIPKNGGDPILTPEECQNIVIETFLNTVRTSANPAVILSESDTLCQKLKEASYQPQDIFSFQSLFLMLRGKKSEKAVVDHFLIPIFMHLLKNEPFFKTILPQVRPRIADLQYLLQWEPTDELVSTSLTTATILENNSKIQEIRKNWTKNLFPFALRSPNAASVLAASTPILTHELEEFDRSFVDRLIATIRILEKTPEGHDVTVLILIPLLVRIIPILGAESPLHISDAKNILDRLSAMVPSLHTTSIQGAPANMGSGFTPSAESLVRSLQELARTYTLHPPSAQSIPSTTITRTQALPGVPSVV